MYVVIPLKNADEGTDLFVLRGQNVDLIILGKRKLKGLKKLTATYVSLSCESKHADRLRFQVRIKPCHRAGAMQRSDRKVISEDSVVQ